MYVRLRYSAFDEDGEPVEEGAHETGYVHGFGTLLPSIEAALEGRRASDRRRITLAPDEAFGVRRREAILECEREEFPEDVAVGDRLEAETADGGIVVLRVLEVHPDAVVVDSNHPLAGQRVAFELEIAEVRPASPEELNDAERRVLTEEEGPPRPREALIPLESLLRSPSQRYETENLESGSPGDDESRRS